jgi:hypothetical protein
LDGEQSSTKLVYCWSLLCTATQGTHKFIARSVLAGRWKIPEAETLLGKVPMPQLEGRALLLYQQVWSPEFYSMWTNAVKGPKYLDNFENVSTFTHLPYHDMESVFWVIYWSLLRAVPTKSKDFEEGVEHSAFQEAFKIITTHGSGMSDLRGALSGSPWGDHLHSALRSLGPMLTTMWTYVSREWGLFYNKDGTTRQDHAHEAVLCLLLREIVRLENEGPLPIKMAIRHPQRSGGLEKHMKRQTMSQ